MLYVLHAHIIYKPYNIIQRYIIRRHLPFDYIIETIQHSINAKDIAKKTISKWIQFSDRKPYRLKRYGIRK